MRASLAPSCVGAFAVSRQSACGIERLLGKIAIAINKTLTLRQLGYATPTPKVRSQTSSARTSTTRL